MTLFHIRERTLIRLCPLKGSFHGYETESYYVFEWVVSRVEMSRVKYVEEACHGTHMNELCRPYEKVVSRI